MRLACIVFHQETENSELRFVYNNFMLLWNIYCSYMKNQELCGRSLYKVSCLIKLLPYL